MPPTAQQKARRAVRAANKRAEETLRGVISGDLKVKNGMIQYPAPAAPRPPAGYYDPALDAQLGQSGRGLGDLRQDVELQDARAAQDYTFGMEGLGRDRDRGYQDIDRQVAVLQRGYQQLARRQGEGNRLAGVMSPGMLAKQMQIRAANQAFERQPLDVARTRFGEDYNVGVGRLGVDYARGGVDRQTGLTRAEREHTQFGLDVGEQQRYQATAAGWIPPPTPQGQRRLWRWPNGSWHSRPPRGGR